MNSHGKRLLREDYIKSLKETIFKYKKYNKPYVNDFKLCCNKTKDSLTAYYTGVDIGTGKTVNVFNTKYIWEKEDHIKKYSGVVALVINNKGCKNIKNITDLSLHLQITATTLKVHILGNVYGEYYYQTLIDTALTNSQDLDGITENEVTLATSGDNVYVYVNGKDSYSGTFIPDENISSLDDVLGQYAILEHFCNGDRNLYCMPQFTKILLRENDAVLLFDDFKREDGILNNSPQGIVYHLFTNNFNFL